MKRSEKKDFVAKLKDEFSNSSSIIVAEYSGLTVGESESLRKEMRANGTMSIPTENSVSFDPVCEANFVLIAIIKVLRHKSRRPTARAHMTLLLVEVFIDICLSCFVGPLG